MSTAIAGRPRPTAPPISRAVAALRTSGWPYLVVVSAVVAANALYLSGTRMLDPLATRAGLGTINPSWLGGNYTLDPNDGFTSQSLGVGAAHQLLSGRFPWWNPYEGLGQPLLGEMQSAALWPFTPILLLPNGFLLQHVLLEIIAGCATVALLRNFGVDRVAATAGGVLFALNGVLAWFHNAVSLPVAFVPLLMLGTERAFRAARAGRRTGWVLIAVTLALSLYSGFPETAYLGGLLTACVAVWRLVGAAGFRVRYLTTLATGVLAGLAVSAPVLVSFVGFLPISDIGPHVDGSYANATLPAGALSMMTTPYAYGPPHAYSFSSPSTTLYLAWSNVGGYLTAATLVLAVIGVFGRRLRGLRLVLAAWTVISLAKSFALPVVTPLVNLIPGITAALFPRYAYPTWILAAIVLAVLAVDDARRRDFAWWRIGVGLAVTAAVLIGGWVQGNTLTEGNGKPGLPTFFTAAYAYAAVSALGMVALLAVISRSPRVRGRVLLTGLLSLEAVVLFAFPTYFAPATYTPDRTLEQFLAERAADPASGRVFTLTPAFLPNYGSYFGVPQLNVNDLPVPQAWTDYVNQRLDPNAPSWLFLPLGSDPAYQQAREDALRQNLAGYQDAAVEWIITYPDVPAKPELQGILQPVVTGDGYVINRLVGVDPYADAAGCTVQVVERTVLDVDCPTASTVVRRELSMPGWRVEVDGTDAVLGTENSMQTVPVPAGRHRVEFSYVPPFGTASIVVAILALLGIVGTSVWRLRHRRPTRTQHGATRDQDPEPGSDLATVSLAPTPS